MNKSIMFLVDNWYPRRSANAVCVKNIAENLMAKGWSVYVSSYEQKKNQESFVQDGITLFFEKLDISRRLLTEARWCSEPKKQKLLRIAGLCMNRFRRLLLLPLYPITSLSLPYRWSKNCCQEIDKYNIDYIVSVMMPEDTIFTGYLIKKKRPEISWSVYYIDAGTNILPGTSFERLKKVLQKRAVRWENLALQRADRVIVMKGHEAHYRKNLSEENTNKLRICDVPLFDTSLFDANSMTATNPVQNWVYTGSLSGPYYDPHKLCKLFMKYRESCEAQLHLYGTSDQAEYLENLNKDSSSGIIWHGLVSHEEVVAAQKKADVLVYFKMCRLDSVSGKFFEYITRGKPVVYYGASDDINSGHVRNYSLGYVADIEKEDSENVSGIIEFLSSCKSHEINSEALKESFRLNLPETTAKVFEDLYCEHINERGH